MKLLQNVSSFLRTIPVAMVALPDDPVVMIEPKRKVHVFRAAGVLAFIAGLVLIASGVASGSILLTILSALDKYLGTDLPFGSDLLLKLAILVLTILVGFGGILVIAGGALLLLKHGSLGRLLIGLGGGMAILGLGFSMAEALFLSGFSSTIFHQSYFTLYWLGAILSTASILFSRKS